MELQPVVSHLLKLSSAWNPFSVEKKTKKSKETNKEPKQKNSGKSRVHVWALAWGGAGVLCSGGSTRCESRSSLEKVSRAGAEWSCSWPLCWVSLVSAHREPLPDTPGQGTDLQELQDCAAAAWRGQCSSLVSWHCSEVAPGLSPGSAPRQLNYTE